MRKVDAKKIASPITSKLSGSYMFLVNSLFFLLSLNKIKNLLEKKLIKGFLAIKRIERQLLNIKHLIP